MKKIALFVGLVIFSMFLSGNVPAVECQGGFTQITPNSDLYDKINGDLEADCAKKKTFHVPPAVPLVLSAIAGLGVIAYRGKIR